MISRYHDLTDRINERARRVRLKDRKLYERGSFPIEFFTMERDVVEFAAYDLGDDLVGWMEIQDGEPIQIPVVTDGETQQNTNIPQIVLDTVDHLKSVGVDKGSLYISYQFLKNRVGSSSIGHRVFIQEISPSRTEVRILPALTEDDAVDFFLVRDFEHFKHNDIFIDDVYRAVVLTYETTLQDDINQFIDNEFLYQFQYDYSVNGAQLSNIKKVILEDTRSMLLEMILQEDDDFMSRNRLQQLFIIVLQQVVDRLIPRINESVVTASPDLGAARLITDRYNVPNRSPTDDTTPTPQPVPIPTPDPGIPDAPQDPETGGPIIRPPGRDPIETDPEEERPPVLPPDGPRIRPPTGEQPTNPGTGGGTPDDGFGGIGDEPGSDPFDDDETPTRFPIDDREDRNNPITVN